MTPHRERLMAVHALLLERLAEARCDREKSAVRSEINIVIVSMDIEAKLDDLLAAPPAPAIAPVIEELRKFAGEFAGMLPRLIGIAERRPGGS